MEGEETRGSQQGRGVKTEEKLSFGGKTSWNLHDWPNRSSFPYRKGLEKKTGVWDRGLATTPS